MDLNDYTPEPDLSRATTLPARWYADPAFLPLEKEKIFWRTWQPVGYVDRVVKPGDFFACDIAGEPLVVVRDAAGKPAALSGYTQGRSEILDAEGDLIFEGRYYDTRTYQALTGDDALTPTGVGICDHWTNGFGRGAFAGHAISIGVHLTRGGDAPFHGQADGRID